MARKSKHDEARRLELHGERDVESLRDERDQKECSQRDRSENQCALVGADSDGYLGCTR